MNWDDLRYVLTVARTGSLSAAARVLKVNRTTVLRRINALETHLNCLLFDRNRSGYAITPEAERLFSRARELEQSILDLEHHIAGEKPEIEGELRVTTTDSILPLLVTELPAFQRAHPRVLVELAVTNNRLNLTRREADVAVRPTVTPPDNLWSRKIGELAFAVYANTRYLNKHAGKPLTSLDWLGLDEPLSASMPGRWMTSEIPLERIRLRADSFVALSLAAEQGLGVALLPCHIGDGARRLKRLGPPLSEIQVGLWILTHGDLIRTARVKVLVDHIGSAIGDKQDLLLGLRY